MLHLNQLCTFGRPARSFKNPSAIFLSLDRLLPVKCVIRVEMDLTVTRHAKTMMIVVCTVKKFVISTSLLRQAPQAASTVHGNYHKRCRLNFLVIEIVSSAIKPVQSIATLFIPSHLILLPYPLKILIFHQKYGV